MQKKYSVYNVYIMLTSSHDKTGFYLKRGSDILTSVNPARVRIWVISTVTAPNKHISCKSCSSRTGPSVTATMIVVVKKLIEFSLYYIYFMPVALKINFKREVSIIINACSRH